jgi:hypothetical protein
MAMVVIKHTATVPATAFAPVSQRKIRKWEDPDGWQLVAFAGYGAARKRDNPELPPCPPWGTHP